MQWREKPKNPTSLPAIQQIPSPPPRLCDESPVGRFPLERNLAISDFPQFPALPPIPSRKEVLNELHEVTLQYTNCADPTESAAHRQRVTPSDLEGLEERTVNSIIASATAARNAVLLGSSSRGDDLHLENMILPPTTAQNLPPTGTKVMKKRGRPAKKIAASPKVSAGAGSSRILLLQSQASPVGGRNQGPSPRIHRAAIPRGSPVAYSPPRFASQ
ncbi:Uncharacterized protein Rs2_10011 [Raphanus sativus]|nr:Uncharacterized protein Rs2_10011 [Raphanus sativus]